jgi:hypothetical protein
MRCFTEKFQKPTFKKTSGKIPSKNEIVFLKINTLLQWNLDIEEEYLEQKNKFIYTGIPIDDYFSFCQKNKRGLVKLLEGIKNSYKNKISEKPFYARDIQKIEEYIALLNKL